MNDLKFCHQRFLGRSRFFFQMKTYILDLNHKKTHRIRFPFILHLHCGFCRWHRLESSISQPKQQKQQLPFCLVISAPKTEYMTVNCNPQPALQVYGDPINHVSDFRYLGSMVASGSSDLKRRKSLAWCAFCKVEQLWESPHIPIATKVKLFNTTCVTILLYGCESLVTSQDMENKINAFATSCYRAMLIIKHIDLVLNTTVYSKTNTVPLIHLVRHRQLKFLGHILRMSKEEPARRYAL